MVIHHQYMLREEMRVKNSTSLRRQIAQLLGADTHEIIFTSGATESNNTAIKGIVKATK